MIITVIRRERICESKSSSAHYILRKLRVELKYELAERCGYFEEPWDDAI